MIFVTGFYCLFSQWHRRYSDNFAVENWMDLPLKGWRRSRSFSRFSVMRCDKCIVCIVNHAIGRGHQTAADSIRRVNPQNWRIQHWFANLHRHKLKHIAHRPLQPTWSTLISPPYLLHNFYAFHFTNEHIKIDNKIRIFTLHCAGSMRYRRSMKWMHFWFTCDCHSEAKVIVYLQRNEHQIKWS